MFKKSYSNTIFKKLKLPFNKITIKKLFHRLSFILLDDFIPIPLFIKKINNESVVGKYNGLFITLSYENFPLLIHELTHFNWYLRSLSFSIICYNCDELYRFEYEIDGYLNQMIMSPTISINDLKTIIVKNLANIIYENYSTKKNYDKKFLEVLIRKRLFKKINLLLD